MQRSDLEAEIARLLNDPNSTRWSLATIDSRIEFAQQDVQIETGAVKTTETLTPTANTSSVVLSTNLLDVLGATLVDGQGNIYPLTGVTLEQLNLNRPFWKNESPGQPDSYYIDYTNNALNLIPAPSASYALAGGLSVLEVQTPTALTGSTSVPFNGNSLMVPYHIALCYWVVAECLMDNSDAESLQKARFYRSRSLDAPGEYERILMKIINRFDKPSDERGRIIWQPAGGRRGGWPVSKSTPLG